MRTIITGHPRAGKSTLASTYPHPRLSSDLLMDTCEWSEQSDAIAREWLTKPGPWTLEGCAMLRALRKYHNQFPDAPPPFDQMLYMVGPAPGVELKPGQLRMAQQCDFIMSQLIPWFVTYGVTQRTRGDTIYMSCKQVGKHLSCSIKKKESKHEGDSVSGVRGRPRGRTGRAVPRSVQPRGVRRTR